MKPFTPQVKGVRPYARICCDCVRMNVVHLPSMPPRRFARNLFTETLKKLHLPGSANEHRQDYRTRRD